MVYRFVRQLICGPWAASLRSCSWAGRSIRGLPSTTRWVPAVQASQALPLQPDTWLACRLFPCLPNLASQNSAFLSLFLFLAPFSSVTSFFLYKIVIFFSKAPEPQVHHMYSDRKHPDLVLIFSCRSGIFHKHRVCQLNIY